MNFFEIIIIVIALVLIFICFGGKITDVLASLTVEKEPEKDYVLIPKPTEDKDTASPPENAFTDDDTDTTVKELGLGSIIVKSGEFTVYHDVSKYPPMPTAGQILTRQLRR